MLFLKQWTKNALIWEQLRNTKMKNTFDFYILIKWKLNKIIQIIGKFVIKPNVYRDEQQYG